MESFIIQENIEEILFNQQENDLSYWEFINNSDIASDGNGSIDTLSLDSLPSWHSSLSSNNNNNQNPLQDLTQHDVNDGSVEENPLQDLAHEEEQVKYDVGFPYYGGYVGEQVKCDVGFLDFYQQQQHHDVVNEEEEQEEEDHDDDDEEEGGDDLDDELVPWHLSGKLGRNRMRKLGKRPCAKMTSAKRNPYRYVKAGCVHGKHGMGLKGSC